MLKKSERTQLFPGNCLDESDIQCLSKNVIQFNLKHILTDFIHILSIQEASIIAKCLLENQEEMQTKAIGTGLRYLEENGIALVGAVQDYTCPGTGKSYMLFPVRKL